MKDETRSKIISLLGHSIALIAIIAVTSFAFDVWDQVCFGVFEERTSCEFRRKIQIDSNICSGRASNLCKHTRQDSNRAGYKLCIESRYCACMTRAGHGDEVICD